MPRVAVYNLEGSQVGEIDLSDLIFGIAINESVLHQAIVMQMANQRQGTASTKTRTHVSGGGRKPWRQKGTGRARAGSTRSPLWRHGGVVFGPHPRKYTIHLPKKMSRLALKSALSVKVRDQELIVVENLTLPEPKTREMNRILDNLGVERKALLVTASHDQSVERSARNIPGILPLLVGGLNPYDIINHDKLVMTREAVTRLEEALA